MNALRAESVKLRRSMSWLVVLLLPVAAVLTATANSLASGEPLAGGGPGADGADGAGWDVLWMRVVVFHGLFPLELGIAVLASLVWRVEHRGGNWNAVMSHAVPIRSVVLAKAGAVTALTWALQAVLLAAIQLTGSFVFDLPGLLPGRYVALAAVAAVAAVPVVAVQSLLSMLLRSFAAPVVVAACASVASVVVLLAAPAGAGLVCPHGVLVRATQLGTGVFADAGTSAGPGVVQAGAVVAVLVAAVLSAAAVLTLSVQVLARRDVR